MPLPFDELENQHLSLCNKDLRWQQQLRNLRILPRVSIRKKNYFKENHCIALITGVPKDSAAKTTILSLLVSILSSKMPTDESITIKLFPFVSKAMPRGRPQWGYESSRSKEDFIEDFTQHVVVLLTAKLSESTHDLNFSINDFYDFTTTQASIKNAVSLENMLGSFKHSLK